MGIELCFNMYFKCWFFFFHFDGLFVLVWVTIFNLSQYWPQPYWFVFRLLVTSYFFMTSWCLIPKAQPGCVQIQKAWLIGTIPAVMDCESTVQEKALECLDQLLLQNIKHYNKFHTGDNSQVLAWALLTLLSTENQELRYVIQIA